MKKLLVFLSIFGVLFVSTIRPLQAEVPDDGFNLNPGTPYYLVIQSEQVQDNLTILFASTAPSAIYMYLSYDNPNNISLVYYEYRSTIKEIYQPLTFLGTTIYDDISYNVYSFVYLGNVNDEWNYDDSYFWVDTENPIGPISIYDTIYALVNKYVFGNNIESGSHQDLTATILSTTICVLVFALPFLIIWKVIKIIMG